MNNSYKNCSKSENLHKLVNESNKIGCTRLTALLVFLSYLIGTYVDNCQHTVLMFLHHHAKRQRFDSKTKFWGTQFFGRDETLFSNVDIHDIGYLSVDLAKILHF